MVSKSSVYKLLVGITSFGILTFAGCGGNEAPAGNGATTSGNTSGGGDVTAITIGYKAEIVQPQPLIGVFNGEYQKQIPGVTFTGKEFQQGGAAVLEALRAGQIDIGCSGVFVPLKAYAKDKDIVLLGGAATGGIELVVGKSSPIKTVADLKGTAIGVNQIGSNVDALLRADLIKAGLNPDKDVRLVTVPPAQQADALKSGQFAAVVAPAPWPSVAVSKGDGRVLLDSKAYFNGGNYLAGSIYTTKKFADAHPDFIKKFIAANANITETLNKDRAKGDADVYAVWSKLTHKTLPDDVKKDAFASITYTNDADPKALQDLADVASQVGVLKGKVDLTGFIFSAK